MSQQIEHLRSLILSPASEHYAEANRVLNDLAAFTARLLEVAELATNCRAAQRRFHRVRVESDFAGDVAAASMAQREAQDTLDRALKALNPEPAINPK